jgi:hypothetical protein
MVLSAQATGQQRLLLVQGDIAAGESEGELARLRDENRRLTAENRLLRARLGDVAVRKRYTPMQRLQILWHMAHYGIPRCRVAEHFLIARSTLYRWLHAAERGDLGEKRRRTESPRRTPVELARMIWDIFEANPHFGRHRIASILWLLGVFVSASTARNVLLQPKPRSAPAAAKAKAAPAPPREIVARYANHVWGVDRTRVLRWGIWPTWVLVAIDHYSRALMSVVPLEGPNAGWVVGALEEAFARHGAPRHLITDQEGVFVSEAFAEPLTQWGQARIHRGHRTRDPHAEVRMAEARPGDPWPRSSEPSASRLRDLLQRVPRPHDAGWWDSCSDPSRRAVDQAGEVSEDTSSEHRATHLL